MKVCVISLKVFAIVREREALEVECDDPGHSGAGQKAWFDCGSHSDSIKLAKAAGWTERRITGTTLWLCPQCVGTNGQKRSVNEARTAKISATELSKGAIKSRHLAGRIDSHIGSPYVSNICRASSAGRAGGVRFIFVNGAGGYTSLLDSLVMPSAVLANFFFASAKRV